MAQTSLHIPAPPPTATPAATPPDRGLRRRWACRSPLAPPPPRTPTPGSLLTRLLASRGLIAPADVERFLSPTLHHLHDPSGIPSLDRAAERILAAARAGEPIVVYGDYDVDGVTAAAILVRALRALVPTVNVATYVPHRIDEGYGLNAAALQELADAGARLVVTVDCGVTAVEPAAAARAAGLDLIITDHHNPPPPGHPLPDCFALVHPRAPGSAYPFPDLCGAGVAYKLAWRLATMAEGTARVSAPTRTLLLDLLALCSLGTVADIVPLVDENRAIVRFGLTRCKTSPIVGLRALVEASGLAGEEIDAEKVGFLLGPRLNAIGRLGHAREAVELLLTEDAPRAADIAAALTRLNDQRKRTEKTIFDHACQLVEEAGMHTDDRRAVVLAHEDWHQGVVGIVCSRLVEKYGRPTLLMRRAADEEGRLVCHGSGRSIDGFDLHAALAACADHLTTYGGHDMAAGLKLPAENLPAFTDAIMRHAAQRLEPADLVPAQTYDTDARLAELTPRDVADLQRLGPFGRANPAPTLRLRHLKLARDPKPFGAASAHTALTVAEEGDPHGRVLRIVAWRMADTIAAAGLRTGDRVEALIAPKISTWNGAATVEPELIDVRRADPPR